MDQDNSIKSDKTPQPKDTRKFLFETEDQQKDRRIAELEAQLKKIRIDFENVINHAKESDIGWNASNGTAGGC